MITNQEESPDPELPRLTVEEKLDRAVRNTVGRDVVSIAYAKSLGRTPEDFGGFAGKTTAFFWDDIKGKGPLAFLRHIHRFLQTDRRLEIEILRCSAEVVEARHTVYGKAVVDALAPLGVTPGEYARYYGAQFQAIAAHLGLRYVQEVANEFVVFSVAATK